MDTRALLRLLLLREMLWCVENSQHYLIDDDEEEEEDDD